MRRRFAWLSTSQDLVSLHRREGENIVIRWSKRCGQTGLGKPDMSRGNPACTPTPGCSARSCRAVDEKPTELLKVTELSSYVNKPRPNDDNQNDVGLLYHVPSANGVPPECSQTN